MEQEERRENTASGWSAEESGATGSPSPQDAVPVENVNDAPAGETQGTPIERAAESARTQAGEAASALRRGELVQNAAVDPDANSDDRLIALLCYLTQLLIPVVMPVIVLLSESSKKRPFQRYHAVQSLGLVLVFALLGVSVAIGTSILQVIPLIGALVGFVVLCLSPIAYLMAVVAMVYYGVQAYQGKRFAIPGLTSFMQDQGWL